MRNRILLATVGCCLWGTTELRAQQSVGVGTTTPNPKAALDVTATDKGVLLPRLTKAQRLAISAPPQGLTVFQTAPDSVGFWYYSGTRWQWTPDAQSATGTLSADNGLTRTGNIVRLGGTLTSATTVAQGGNNLSFTGGNVGVGTTSPSTNLHVEGNARITGLTTTGVVTTDASGNLSSQTVSSIQDNLGNHTATQNLNLQGNALTGTGASIGTTVGIGVRVDGGLNMGQNGTGNNLLIGFEAGKALIPNPGLDQGHRNQIVGYQAGQVITTGTRNTFSGYRSGQLTTTGSGNTFSGANSGRSNTTGEDNVFTGSASGVSNTTGFGNVFYGTVSGQSNTTGNSNTFIGNASALSNTTGSQNVFCGTSSGIDNTTGSRNTAVGFNSGVSSGSLSNATALGANALVSQSNSLVLGGTGANAVSVGIGTTAPSATLHVVGGARITGLTTAGVVTTDASGNLSSQSIASIGDNLGNHTATQNVDLATNRLVGNGGTVGINISSAGNVGINQPSPGFQLHVGGSFRAALTNGNFSLYNNAISGGTVLLGAFDGTGGAGAQVRFSGASGFMDIGQNSSGSFVVEGNDVARFTVQNAGNVGIGTTSPSALLDVNGSTRLRGLTAAGVVTTDASGNLSSATAASLDPTTANNGLTKTGNNFALGGTLTGATSIAQAGFNFGFTGGSVGIGTASPTAPLHVVGGARITGLTTAGVVTTDASGNLSSATAASLDPTTASNGLTKTGNNFALGGALTGATSLAQAGFNFGFTGGSVGIGTASPLKRLHVDAGNDFLRLDNLPNVTNTNNYLVIDASGNVGKTQVENVAGQIIRLGFNGGSYFENVATPANAETALRFSNHSNATQMGSAPNAAANFINTITGASITTGVSATAGNGSPTRTTDQITLPAGVYRVTVRLCGNYISGSGATRSTFVKFIVGNNEYSLVESLNSPGDNIVTHTEVSDYINLGSSQTLDFTIRPLRNFNLLDRQTPVSGNSYRSLLLIERLR